MKSLLAIVCGFLVTFLLATATNLGMAAAMPESLPPGEPVTDVAVLLLTQGYVAVYAIFGCWITARMAPGRPMAHALALGAIALVMSIAVVATAWEMTPAWYNVLSLVMVMPYAWMGGRLREMQLHRAAGAIAA